MINSHYAQTKLDLISASFDLQATPLENLYDGLDFCWIFDKRVSLFIAQNSSRQVVDVWYAKMIDLGKSNTSVFFNINDFSAKECFVTPYSQQKNITLGKQFPNVTSYSASVMQNGLSFQLSRLFTRTFVNSNFKIHLSTSLMDSVQWVHDNLEKIPVLKKS